VSAFSKTMNFAIDGNGAVNFTGDVTQ